MRIVHDAGRCASIGMCEAIAPDVFEVGPDGALRVLRDTAEEGMRERLEEAVEACPTQSLRLVD